MAAVAAAAFTLGVSSPAIAHVATAAAHKIDGNTIKVGSVAGNRLKNNTLTGKQIKESTLGAVPRAKSLPPLHWHLVTKFEHSWSNTGGADLRPAAYAVDAQGIVHLEGAIHGGNTDTSAFTLPTTVAPAGLDIYVPIVGDDVDDYLEIDNGQVFVESSGATNTVTALTNLEGATFAGP